MELIDNYDKITHLVIPLNGKAPSTTVSSILSNHFLDVTFVMNTL